MSRWYLTYDDFEPGAEGLREALCTLGNGYFCTRGAADEATADAVHYPGTYIAGGYNRLQTEIDGHIVENEDLVNMPNWLPLSFRIEDGSWFDLDDVTVRSYRQKLDLKRGLLERSIRFEDDQGRRTAVVFRRLVHMAQPHLAAQQLELTAENWSGRIEIRSALDGTVINDGVARYRSLNNRHLEPMDSRHFADDGISIKVQTRQSRLQVAVAARTTVHAADSAEEPMRRTITENGMAAQLIEVAVEASVAVRVQKVVALYTSRDPAISEPGLQARRAVMQAGDFDDLLESHTMAWKHLWQHFDITFEYENGHQEETMSRVLHLHIFHLLQTTSINNMVLDLDVGVPARGWHGEAYRGHIFWDELFIFPLLNWRLPEITRRVLLYRYRRLDAARAAASHLGYGGAMFPWQSGSDGREESQQVHLNPRSGRWIPDKSWLQRHVSAAIAYNVYQYFQVTRDMEFLCFYGAEMVLEIARFWSGIATFNREKDRYVILKVMGPDEYHDAYPDADAPGLNNNAYTNVMAVWVLERALEILEMLPEERCDQLAEKLDLLPEERRRWRAITEKMFIPFHDDGIISQFEGYERLEEFDWEGYRERYGDIQRLDRILENEDDTPNRYRLSKQADVLMLFYLFSAEELEEIFKKLDYPFDQDTIPKNIDYYIRRTSHGSTLSRVVHSWVLARRNREQSWKLFNQALCSDLMDIQGGTTPEGIHLGAMAGTVDQVQRCYSGIVIRDDVLWLNPCLPGELACICLRMRYRGYSLHIELCRDRVTVSALRGDETPIRIGCLDAVRELKGDDTITFTL